MPCLRQGSLHGYLRAHHDSVDGIRRLRWLQEAARIIRRVHERRVLVADIATRNFLVDENLSLQMCDFTESVIVPNNEEMGKLCIRILRFSRIRHCALWLDDVRGHLRHPIRILCYTGDRGRSR